MGDVLPHGPNDPASWFSCPWVLPSPSMSSEPSDLICISQIWQRWWMSLLSLSYKRLWPLPGWQTLLHSWLTHFDEASFHIGEICIARNWGQPLSGQHPLRNLGPQSMPSRNRAWNWVQKQISPQMSIQRRPHSELTPWLQPCARLWGRRPSSAIQDFWPTETMRY